MSAIYNSYLFDLPNYSELLKETSDEVLKAYHFNCGGFALGNYEWYLPSSFPTEEYLWEAEEEDEMIEEVIKLQDDFYNGVIDHYEACTAIGEIYMNSMCKDLRFVRRIESESELKEGEYLVAFKAAISDFHYARKLTNGRWFHKMGGCDIEEITEDKVLGSEWWRDMCCDYDGDLFFMAVRLPNKQEMRKIRKLRHR